MYKIKSSSNDWSVVHNWNLISSFMGTIIGGGITYCVQTKLQKNKEKKLHKAYLLQT